MFAAIRSEIKERGEYRFGPRWSRKYEGQFAISPWQWSVALIKFSRDWPEGGEWSLHFFCFWVSLWSTSRPVRGEMLDKWGFTYDSECSTLQLCWGHRYKFIYMPWMLDHCRVEMMRDDGSFVAYDKYPKGCPGIAPEPPGTYRQSFPYRYVLKSGEVQDRTATVTVERRSWCWRAWPFKSLRWPSHVRTGIDVEFNDEVGERSGSWKGGTVGCGYDLLPGETPEQCLRRMERERRF